MISPADTRNNYKLFLPNAAWPPSRTRLKLPGGYVFSSRHPGGIQSVFGDGSVKFIKNGIDANIWYSLHTIKNGEVVDSSSLN